MLYTFIEWNYLFSDDFDVIKQQIRSCLIYIYRMGRKIREDVMDISCSVSETKARLLDFASQRSTYLLRCYITSKDPHTANVILLAMWFLCVYVYIHTIASPQQSEHLDETAGEQPNDRKSSLATVTADPTNIQAYSKGVRTLFAVPLLYPLTLYMPYRRVSHLLSSTPAVLRRRLNPDSLEVYISLKSL